MEFIFYTDEYFMEKKFEEIIFSIERSNSFIQSFHGYDKTYEFKLNLENIKNYIFSEAMKEAYLKVCEEIFGREAKFVNKENIDDALNEIYEKIVKNMNVVKLEKYFYGVTIYSKKIFISNYFQEKISQTSLDRLKVTYLAGLVKTILHEIINCLINYLPLYSKEYSELSIPFIRTFKKNIKIYDYVVRSQKYILKGNESDILEEEIEKYKLIEDPCTLFENKLFENNPASLLNYSTSEYFLNINNLNQSITNFTNNLKKFEQNINASNELKSLNTGTTVCFKTQRDSFYFGRCLLDPNRPLSD